MDGEVNEEANDVTIVIVGTSTNQGKKYYNGLFWMSQR
jgi:hypothetical protein